MNVFPFTLQRLHAERLFHGFIERNRAMLDEEHGNTVFVGEDCAKRCADAGDGINQGFGYLKTFSWAHVDAEVLSDREVSFTWYDSDAHHTSDTHTVVSIFKEGELERHTDRRKAEIVTSVRLQREREAEELRIQKAEEAIYKELFGS